MQRPARRSDIPVLLGAFVGGFLLSFLLIFLWLRLFLLAPRGERVVVEEVPVPPETIQEIVPGKRKPAPEKVKPAAPEKVKPAAPKKVKPAAPEKRKPAAAPRTGAGEIGTTERRIFQRLAALPVPKRPITTDLRVRAWNVTWTDGRRPPFARVAYIAGLVDIKAAERGDVIVNQTLLRDANVLVEQPSAGAEWNYQRVFARLLNREPTPSAPAGRTTTVRLNDVTLENVTTRVRSPTSRFTIAQMDAQLPRVTFSAPGLSRPELVASRVDGTYIDEKREARLAFDLRNATARFPKSEVEFTVATAGLDQSRFENVRGMWKSSLPGLGVRIAGRGTRVRLADLRFFSPRIPEEGVGSFDFEIVPVTDRVLDLRLANANITADESHITGAVHARVGGERTELITIDARLEPLTLALIEKVSERELPYAGALRGTVRGTATALSFDVLARLTTADVTTPFETRAVGVAALTPAGFELRRLTAELRNVPVLALRPLVPRVPFGASHVSGTVTLTGPPKAAPLTLAVRLDVAGGLAIVNGTVDLTGAVPAYDLTGQLVDVNLQQIFRPTPPAHLTATFAVAGSGSNANNLNARLRVNGRFTGWRAQPRDTLALNGTVRGGTLVLADTARVNLGPVHLAVFGNWHFVEPMSGALAYAFDITSLREIAPYIPALPDTVSAGRVSGRGTISGTLAQLQINGSVAGRDVGFGKWTAATLTAEHQLVLGPAIPQINARFAATGITTPAAGDFTDARGTIRLRQPDLALAFTADRADGSKVELTAAGIVPSQGQRRIVLEQLRLDAASGHWALVAPAVIQWLPSGPITVRNLEVRNTTTAGLVRLDGTVYPIAQLNVHATAENLPIAEVQRLFGVQPRITGLLNASGAITGPPSQPTVNINFALTKGSIDGVNFTSAQGEIRYVRNALVAQASAVIDSAGKIEVVASLPAIISLEAARKFHLVENGAVSGSLRADSLNLTPFERLFPEVRDLRGYVTAHATLSGTVANPDLAGEGRLVNAEMTVLSMNQRYTQMSGLLTFENRRAVIREVRARSGGWAVGTGYIVFETLDKPSFDLTFTLTGFRAMGVEDHTAAAATGTLRLTGAVNTPVLTGNVTLNDGDVAVPSVGANPVEQQLASIGDPSGIAAMTAIEEQAGFFNALRIEGLVLRAGNSVWFDVNGARAQLSGTLRVDKTPEDWILTGELHGTRGTYVLEAGPIVRRFQIVNAEVRFLGTPEINPAIDITARRTIIDQTGRTVDIDVRIAGTLQSPTLSLASADASSMGQEELLSFLLFGEQRIGLTGSVLPGGDLLEETFFGGLAEIASIELERSLGMPFDIFQVRLGPGTVGGLGASSVVAGVELSPNVFMTVEYGVGALFGDADIQNNYAVRLEWRIDRRTSLRAGYEPVNPGRFYRSFGLGLPVTQIQPRQVTVELRRRWNW